MFPGFELPKNDLERHGERTLPDLLEILSGWSLFVERCREWQKNNPDWELLCDIHNTDHLYVQWSELPKRTRMWWVGKYGSAAKDMFEEFGDKSCKVEKKVLDRTLRLHSISDWPDGLAMTVYRTSIDGVRHVD